VHPAKGLLLAIASSAQNELLDVCRTEALRSPNSSLGAGRQLGRYGAASHADDLRNYLPCATPPIDARKSNVLIGSVNAELQPLYVQKHTNLSTLQQSQSNRGRERRGCSLPPNPVCDFPATALQSFDSTSGLAGQAMGLMHREQHKVSEEGIRPLLMIA
jgi:hypothetical protein